MFDRAMAALRAWQAQIGAGVEVVPHGAHVEDGGTVVLVARVGGLWTAMPCRVVYADDSPEGFAFAYGTLPGHPECGEVAFRIHRSAGSNEIFFRIASFSRTVDPLAKLGSPIARRIQKRVTERYLSAIAEASAEPRRLYPPAE